MKRKFFQFLKVVTVSFLLLSCISYHYISKDSLLSQVQRKAQKFYVIQDSLEGYDFRTIKQIECLNKKKELVTISIDQNTNLEVYTNNGDVVKMYFTTVKLYNDTLYGLRSRILGIPRKIALKDIKEIQIYSEFKIEKK